MAKVYRELQFADNFIFCKVMTAKPDLCRQLVELITGKKIHRIEFLESEKTVEISPNSKGIRMDVYLDDEEGTVYDLEMQTTRNPNLAKRVRYYQGIIDMNHLEKGQNYQDLPDSVIIFICTFDPLGLDLPVYRFENRCVQDTSQVLDDHVAKIFVNSKSTVAEPETELRNLLAFINNNEICNSAFTKALSEAVTEAKSNRRWEMEYMQWRAVEMDIDWAKKQAAAEGRAEGRAEGLEAGRAEGLEAGRAEGLEAGRAEGEYIAIYKLYDQSLLTADQAATTLSVTVEAFLNGYEKWGYQRH